MEIYMQICEKNVHTMDDIPYGEIVDGKFSSNIWVQMFDEIFHQIKPYYIFIYVKGIKNIFIKKYFGI